MQILNLDEDLKPLLKVTVGGKDYEVVDVSPSVAMELAGMGSKDIDITRLHELVGEILGAKPVVLANLGLRRTRMLLNGILSSIEAETKEAAEEAKKVQEAGETPST